MCKFLAFILGEQKGKSKGKKREGALKHATAPADIRGG
jgi:hypothetical protein